MIQFHFLTKRCASIVAVIGLLGLVTACQSIWEPDPDFGSTVTGAIQAQSVNPDAPAGNKKVTKGLDGPSAKSGVDNYQKSFEVKVPTSSGTYPTGATMGTSSGAR